MRQFINQGRHRIIDDRRRFYYGRNTDSDDRNPCGFFCNTVTVISHTGTRIDSCICNLDRPAQTADTAGSQRIYHDQIIRFYFADNSCNNLLAFHACLGHNAGHNGTDGLHLLIFIGPSAKFFYNMPCDIQIICHLRSQRIRCHKTIAKAGYQDRRTLQLMLRLCESLSAYFFLIFSTFFIILLFITNRDQFFQNLCQTL